MMSLDPQANKYDMSLITKMSNGDKLVVSVERGDTLITVSEPVQNTLNYLSAHDYHLVSVSQCGYMNESDGITYDCIFQKSQVINMEFPNFGHSERFMAIPDDAEINTQVKSVVEYLSDCDKNDYNYDDVAHDLWISNNMSTLVHGIVEFMKQRRNQYVETKSPGTNQV